ncbi:luciferin sulfotransferase-like [Euwallacea similis]|uniref:luciferin sulfotransferase-like n=1 Tax=Euwallacea similis TaxID=1736056 RepID=UPI00344B3BAA
MQRNQEPFYLKRFDGRRTNSGRHESETNPSESLGKSLLPITYAKFAERIFDAPIYKDDVWLVSFHRTGSTWCQEIIWLINNNLDFETAKTTLQQFRAPHIETSIFRYVYVDSVKSDLYTFPIPRYKKADLFFDQLPSSMESTKTKLMELFADSVSFVENMPSPRCLRTHLPVELLPEKMFTVKPKMIYTMRNPKDLCISYYFFCKMVHKLEIEFDEFCELFLNDAIPSGSVFHHYFGFWNKRNELDILFIRYEELKTNTPAIVRKIAQFLGKTLSDDGVSAICDFLSFQNMRKNKALNLQLDMQVLMRTPETEDFYEKSGTHFIRKGIVGDHKNYMSAEMIERFDKWIEKNTKGTDLAF